MCPMRSPRLEVLLRDFRNGEKHAIDPKLMDYLVDVAALVGVPPAYSVISGYRSPETNERLHERSSGCRKHSLHMQGRAIDVRMSRRGLRGFGGARRILEAGRRWLLPRVGFRAFGYRQRSALGAASVGGTAAMSQRLVLRDLYVLLAACQPSSPNPTARCRPADSRRRSRRGSCTRKTACPATAKTARVCPRFSQPVRFAGRTGRSGRARAVGLEPEAAG